MGILARAVITGFGLSLGAALYKRVSKQLGFEESEANEQAAAAATEDASDPDDEC